MEKHHRKSLHIKESLLSLSRDFSLEIGVFILLLLLVTQAAIKG